VTSLLQQARLALRELETRPHKRFGQNFLVDPAVVSRIVQAADIHPTDTVLEIGPGLGVLSELLAGVAGRLYLVEVDTILADRLRRRFAQRSNVHVIAADFLELDIGSAFSESPIRVVASLPYNVATPILFRLLEHRRQFPTATVMLQKEVAERLSAKAGTKEYGALSVVIQLYAVVAKIMTVQSGSFFPAPKVQSQVVKLTFQEAPRVAIQDDRRFRQVVKAAFAQRRKTLRNTLKAAGYHDLEALSVRTGIDFQRRGETLSVEEFAELANALDPSIEINDSILYGRENTLNTKKEE
jgi:16S rRNA (adenine1518-N6/adenine1519-N6)-dimethyltransferase